MYENPNRVYAVMRDETRIGNYVVSNVKVLAHDERCKRVLVALPWGKGVWVGEHLVFSTASAALKARKAKVERAAMFAKALRN